MFIIISVHNLRRVNRKSKTFQTFVICFLFTNLQTLCSNDKSYLMINVYNMDYGQCQKKNHNVLIVFTL